MAIARLVPTASGNYTAMALFGGGIDYANMSDGSDTTGVQNAADSVARKHSFLISALPPAVTIAKVELVGRGSLNTGSEGNNERWFTRYNGTDDLTMPLFSMTTSAAEFRYVFPTAPGGLAWTPGIIALTEIGASSGADTMIRRFVDLYMEVTYGPIVGGFSFGVA